MFKIFLIKEIHIKCKVLWLPLYLKLSSSKSYFSLPVPVRQGRNYAAIRGSIPLSVFGTEGEADGQLCRPWGVCCSREGLILVANRSNNRIEVFDKTGQFLYNFGKPGKGNGEFERPASVTCDRMNRVIVTDKDNHRIQIFTIKGMI